MKIRTDFVTNSSSSCYIIDKNKFDGEFSVQGINEKIKQLYDENEEKLPKIKKYLKDKYDVDFEDIKWSLCEDICSDLGIKFDIDPSCLRLSGHCKFDESKFTVRDYRDMNVEIDIDSEEVLCWVNDENYTCYNPEYKGDCDACRDTECEAYDLVIKKRKLYGDETLSRKEIMRLEMLKLGEICVHSYDGEIEFNVVHNLEKICAYYCEHMG